MLPGIWIRTHLTLSMPKSSTIKDKSRRAKNNPSTPTTSEVSSPIRARRQVRPPSLERELAPIAAPWHTQRRLASSDLEKLVQSILVSRSGVMRSSSRLSSVGKLKETNGMVMILHSIARWSKSMRWRKQCAPNNVRRSRKRRCDVSKKRLLLKVKQVLLQRMTPMQIKVRETILTPLSI